MYCSPLTVDVFPTDFYISVNVIAEALFSSKLYSSAGPDKISAWLLRENAALLQYCVAPCALSLMHQSVKDLFHRCGSLPMSPRSRSIHLHTTLTLTFDRSPLHQSLARSWSHSFINDSSNRLLIRSILLFLYSLDHYKGFQR